MIKCLVVELIDNLKIIKKQLIDKGLLKEIMSKKNEMIVLSELFNIHIMDYASKESNLEEYMTTYVDLTIKFNNIQDEYTKLVEKEVIRHRKEIRFETFIDELSKCDKLKLEFNDRLFNLTIDKIKVYNDNHLEFNFKDGSIININI